MNSIHDKGPQDKSLNDDLEKLEGAYQQLSPEEPPELLDQAIQNRAHRAVEKKTGWMDFGWVHGLTTAAVIVLTISIILTQSQPVPFEENGVELKQERPQEIRQETRQELRKDAVQNIPAAEDADSRAGSSTSMRISPPAMSASPEEPVDDIRAKKVHESSEMVMEADVVQSDSETEIMVPASTVTTFADESMTGRFDVDKRKSDQVQTQQDQLLQAILLLKQAGDQNWKSELDVFKKLYPAYPLPLELKE